MRLTVLILVLFSEDVSADDTLFTNPHYPPLVYCGGEYNFYKYTPKYVPDDLLQCLKILGTSEANALERFSERSVNEVVERGIYDRGYRIRKEFCLEGYSSFTNYFHRHGIYYPYAMQSYILLTFHQYLRGEKIRWQQNKTLSLKDHHRENDAWRKRARQLFKTYKAEPVVEEKQDPITEEDQFFQW